MHNVRMTSRTDATGISHPSGSRGVTQYYADNRIPLPSGSVLEPPLESIDLAQAHLKEALLFALPLGLFLWIAFALVIRALFF